MNRRYWIASILLMVAICTYLFNYFYELERTRQIAVVNSHQRIHARLAAKSFDELIAKWNGVLSYLATDPAIVTMNDQGRQELAQLRGILKDEIRGITRTDPRGVISFTIPPVPGSVGADISGQKHMTEILRSHAPVVSDVFHAVQGYQAIVIHHPVFRDGEYAGTLAFLLDFEEIAKKILDEIRIGRSGRAWLLSSDGVELYCQNPAHTGRSIRDSLPRPADLLQLAKVMLTGAEGTGAFPAAPGANGGGSGVIAYYLPIRTSNTFWSLAVTYDEQEITASIASFRDKLIGVLFLALLGGISLSYYGIKTWSILRERQARERAEQQLLESEAHYRLLFEENPAPMLIYDRQTREVLAVNRSFLRHYGYAPEQAVGMDLADLHPENEQHAFRDMIRELHGYRNTGEWHHRKQDGTAITIVACSDDLEYQGRNARVAVFTDVTDRKLAEEALLRSLKEKEVLLKEIHHRVKNNLQVITSLLSMQAAQMSDGPARAALTESQARVRSIALVHEQFYGASDLSRVDLLAYGQGLTERLAHMWYSPGVSFTVEGEPVEVGVDVAVPFALILNELLTNALKHAFTGREGGTVSVRIRRSEPGTVELSVRDNGIGFPEGKDLYRMVSTGMTLIVGLLEQLSGTIVLEREGGSGFVVRFPG